VFLGRFTAALRVLVPSLAGMSRMHYPTFLAFNVAGAVAWGTAFTLLGYFAGASWRQVERVASRTGLVLLGLVIAGFALAFVVRRIRRRRSPEA
jgi:undecaprenyl-diphosphatase